jgi:hypothetical protein
MAPADPQGPPPPAAGPVLWLCGPTGVGTSTVGFAVYLALLRAGFTAAYVDLDQIGFCGSAVADHRVRASNLAAMWRTFRAAGAEALVTAGPVQDRTALAWYQQALPASTLTVVRLHGDRDALTDRITRRGRGEGWPQPGDPLIGRSVTELRRIADRAVADADALERTAIGDRVDTSGRAVEAIANDILARWQLSWPELQSGHA